VRVISGKNTTVRYDASPLTDLDIYLFSEGTHFRLYDKLGSHPATVDGISGTRFSVWAPNAASVSVIGDFNGWDPESHPLQARRDESGIFEGFIYGVGPGALYKYHIVSRHGDFRMDKGDPFAFLWEVPPDTASVVCDLDYRWGDGKWMNQRTGILPDDIPVSIYEVHPGSWRRKAEKGESFLNYRELGHELAEYVHEMGFTHVEFLPLMEHPFYGSWGYQTLGYYAPTARYGTPSDCRYMIDHLHRQGIGVILDWVPSHFPDNGYGLCYFDGTHLFEHADPRMGFHPEWKSYIFDYGRPEVRSFLLSSAFFWLDRYHADALRVDAVSSMLYRDYARRDGEWVPNRYGGKENLEAISLLRRLNSIAGEHYPGTAVIAEESTIWSGVTVPTEKGGLGFSMKWNLGWMHDTLEYFRYDPAHRYAHPLQLPYSLSYAFSERFLLPLSHDEVVYGKGSLLCKMPGDDRQKSSNLRLLLGYMFMHPGKKLLFMGGEFGQWQEWNHDKSLDWHLLRHAPHQGISRWVADLNRLYRREPALYKQDFDPHGFSWVDCGKQEKGVLGFIRGDQSTGELLFVACNCTQVPLTGYRFTLPADGFWQELLNSDAEVYGGSGMGNSGGIEAASRSLLVTLAPLSLCIFKHQGD
jgi:1,4-alpha-glucan branching enzyme